MPTNKFETLRLKQKIIFKISNQKFMVALFGFTMKSKSAISIGVANKQFLIKRYS